MNRVLVTGASGFIGHHALRPLVDHGYEVHGVSSRGTRDEAEGVRWHLADLLDSAQLDDLIATVRPTHLLHLAWEAKPGRYWTSPRNVLWLEASLRILRRFHEAGGERVVMAGTCAEYDWTYGFCSEAVTPLKPARLYGRCKVALQEVAAEYADQNGISFAWGRVFFLYGPREPPGRLVSDVSRRLLAGEDAPTSPGTQLRDFLYVQDVADGLCALLTSNVQGALNIASGRPVAVREVVNAIAAAAGGAQLLRWGAHPLPQDEPPLIVADVRRLHRDVGFTPQWDLGAGMHATVDWAGKQIVRNR